MKKDYDYSLENLVKTFQDHSVEYKKGSTYAEGEFSLCDALLRICEEIQLLKKGDL